MLVGCEPGPSTSTRTRTWAEVNVRPRSLLCEQTGRTQRQEKTGQDKDTTPAVKRMRVAVDGLDPDSKRILARKAHYRAKKADGSVVPSQ